MLHRMPVPARRALGMLAILALLAATGSVFAASAADEPGLLFRYSADHGLNADFARGDSVPNFADKVKVVPNGHVGPGLSAAGDQVLSWQAPGNIQAQRGTLSFFWRARDPVGGTPFPLFRVGYGDHTSWDMVWLRLDWNGHGFDAFVTDNNLARTRVSWTTSRVPTPDEWTHLAVTWDETSGVRLYVGGVLVASKNATTVLDAALDQFGPHSRIISPHQVQSAYQYLRGGDLDEVRVYDHQLTDTGVAALAHDRVPEAGPAPVRDLALPVWRNEWWFRFGWNRAADPPPYLADAATRIRKVEFVEARDLKERMTNGNDGIAETTWPGVYNRSRLPGRHDYFELPDWNVYVEGGRSITFTLADEPWNRLEFQGAAYGPLTFLPAAGKPVKLGERPKDQERTWHAFAPLVGGKLRFDNIVQETPIQELAAYDVTAGAEPADERTLYYSIAAHADPAEYPNVDELVRFIDGRYVADERTTVVALPRGAPSRARASHAGHGMPVVHVLIPGDFRQARAAEPVGHYSYGWENMDAGLDGIAIDLPALQVKPTHGGLFPLNIQIKDPLWPARNLLDVSVSVKPGEARTLWLDTRDRMLPPGHGLYLTLAGAGQDFTAGQLDGAAIRLKFKPRAQALPEHVADRFGQARDNLAFLVEEYDNTRRLARFERLDRDLTDLLRVAPDNRHAREFWAELNPEQGWPDRTLEAPPSGVPLWAFRQVESLKRVRQYVNWWIDNRQVPFGDFGGGISDDDDLTQQWPGLGLMGADPDKLRGSVDTLVDAAYKDHMITNGLGTIKTDELHSYEEAVNAKSEALYLSYGDPKTVERLMETARNYGRIVETNGKGHTHIVSSYYSGTDVTREGIWGWSKPYSYLILHPGVLLADYNGNPTVRKLVIDLADSHMAHGRQDADGSWTFPEEINATTEEARGVLIAGSRGNVAIMQLFWAAYRWTGDEKYLRPLLSEVARGSFGSVAEINANLIDLLGKRASWGAALQKSADDEWRSDDRSGVRENQGAGFADFAAWQASGDTKYLEKLYGDQIVIANNRMYMVTESHWWSDRVELFSDLLQRSRLGGMALRRNQFVPGHIVSWRFAAADGAQKLAILVRGTSARAATATKFKVIAYNLAEQPLSATMTGWDVAPGRWRISQGIDASGAGNLNENVQTRSVDFERTRAVDLVFAPRTTTVLELELQAAGKPLWERPDLGVGAADVRLEKRSIRVTLHSLGSVATSPAALILQDASGRELARASVPVMAAPLDLMPKTVEIALRRPRGVATSGLRIRVVGPADVPEITMLNNEVVLP